MYACVTAIPIKETMSSGVSKVEYMGGVGGKKRREEMKKLNVNFKNVFKNVIIFSAGNCGENN